jgi:hypothetical protein
MNLLKHTRHPKPSRGKRVEALNRIEEFKSALARKVTHYISFLVFAVTYNAGCTFFDSNPRQIALYAHFNSYS